MAAGACASTGVPWLPAGSGVPWLPAGTAAGAGVAVVGAVLVAGAGVEPCDWVEPPERCAGAAAGAAFQVSRSSSPEV
ncbi:Uncharacterised protein [Mycobacteroides abscessus subsp. massiliense]|nr:Uncharacterised protein [Mycobacteroides abscessus subsp. massiliense]